ncbi:MAG: hypothetical protein ACK4OE_18465 [Acidovorax sp.]|uniref:hypothetical protein n=1 Tax=Acidovorax sp. TaxID=1872122 RepID=UPI003918E034
MTHQPLTAALAAQPPAALPAHWAQHLMSPTATGPTQPPLSTTEAARVQRHRDQLMAALQAQDRTALLCAKQEVLEDAFCPHSANAGADAPGSPALRSALRDLSWRMAGLLLPRRACH